MGMAQKRLSFPSRISISSRITKDDFADPPTRIPQIQEIFFHSSNITGDGLIRLLRSCPNAIKLEMNYCNDLTDHGIENAALDGEFRLSNLTDLMIDSQNVTHIGMIRFLTWTPNLTQLQLSNKQLSVETAQTLVEHCGQLRSLILISSFPGYDLNAALLLIVQGCSHLSTLKKCGGQSSDVAEEVILALAEHSHHLMTLWMPHSYAVTDRALLALLRGCSQLTSLDITASPRLTNEGIIAMAPAARNLTELKVGYNHLLTDAAVAAIAEHCPQLRALNISSCANLGAKSLWALRDHAHCLVQLYIGGFHKMFEQDVAVLKANYRLRGVKLMVSTQG